MMLRYVIEGHGAGEHTVADAEDAARKLAQVLRSAYTDTAALAVVLHNVLGPLRIELVTEGAREVSQGREWSGQRAGLVVTLGP